MDFFEFINHMDQVQEGIQYPCYVLFVCLNNVRFCQRWSKWTNWAKRKVDTQWSPGDAPLFFEGAI